MDKLQADVGSALATIPQPPVLAQPCEAGQGDPALAHDLEGVQLAVVGNLHRSVSTWNLSFAQCKGADPQGHYRSADFALGPMSACSACASAIPLCDRSTLAMLVRWQCASPRVSIAM